MTPEQVERERGDNFRQMCCLVSSGGHTVALINDHGFLGWKCSRLGQRFSA